MERGHAFGPDDALVVMAGLDDRAQQARHADAVAAHLHRHAFALVVHHHRTHRFGILGAEEEDLPHLDRARGFAARLGDGGIDRLVMGLVGAGVGGGPFPDDGRAFGAVVVIHHPVAEGQVGDRGVVEDLAFARCRQHQEFMRVVTADGARGGAHRNGFQAHAFIGAQVADHVAVVGMQGRVDIDVEIVAILHQEFAAPHHAEARAYLVAEFPLDVIQGQRQVLVAVHVGPEDVGDHLFVRRPVEHVALVAVGDAQHFFAIVVIAPAFAPQVGGLQGGHQKRDVTGADLFLMHDLFDPPQHLEAQRQPGIDARRLLLDHARAQHVAMADDLRLGRVFLEHGQEITGQTHRAPFRLGFARS